MKPKFRLRLRSFEEEASTSNPTQTPPAKKKHTRHLSLHHEKQQRKKRDAKRDDIKKAVEYCRANNCKGWKAIADLDLQLDPRTINEHLAKGIVQGENQNFLTNEEERTLVRYLINRNRSCQGLNDNQVSGVIINILSVRRTRNKQNRSKAVGSWKNIPLSKNAKMALQNNKVSRSFFRRFRTEHPEVRPKAQHKVSVKRGLRCTEEMAIDYLDELAHLLIEVGIGPELKQVAPGVWEGKIDVSRIVAHDETPQFINHNASGQSKKKVFAGTSDDCAELSKENRESVTVQPFSNFAGELLMVQVVFAGAGITSQMCPKNAEEKIQNLLISVNDKGCTNGDTLFEAYKELFDSAISPKRKEKGDTEETYVIIADGHKSRFDTKVLKHCEKNKMDQFILWPDTSGATQKHDQINSQLHSKYEQAKSKIFTAYSDLNRECFMNILAEVINDWATPENLIKAGKKVGITSDGLSIKWMDQGMFARAAAILNPETPTTSSVSLSAEISSPEGVRKNSAEYWRKKYSMTHEKLTARQQLEYPLEEVEGLLPFKTVKPTATNKRKITDVHGTLKATDIRRLMEEKDEEEKKKEEKKKEKVELKEAIKVQFLTCKEQCHCDNSQCKAIQLQQCSVCKNVDMVEVTFMHPKIGGYWDWPKQVDKKNVSAKFIFYGPCIPDPPKPRQGFKFPEEESAKLFYKVLKNTFGK